MEAVYRVDVKEENLTRLERFMWISTSLYCRKKRRSIGYWLLLLYLFFILFTLNSGPGSEITFRQTMMNVAVLSAILLMLFRRLRSLVFIKALVGIRKLRRLSGKYSPDSCSFLFYEDYFTVVPGPDSMVWKYGVIDNIAEDFQAYYIYFADKKGCHFSKNAFTVGNPDGFKQFLEEKTGRQILWVEKKRKA